RSARSVPIVLELAPRGMSRATVPVPDPLNGWKSEKRNQRAKTTATRATTAAIRPRRLRGSPGVLEVRVGMVRGLTRAPGRGRTPVDRLGLPRRRRVVAPGSVVGVVVGGGLTRLLLLRPRLGGPGLRPEAPGHVVGLGRPVRTIHWILEPRGRGDRV